MEKKYTTGHCKNHNQPGGCQLHNIHCGYPYCDRKPIVWDVTSDQRLMEEITYCPSCGAEDGGTSCGLPECGLKFDWGSTESDEDDTTIELIQELSKTLESVMNGLLWYQDMFPDTVNAADHEMLEKIIQVLNKADLYTK